MNRWTRKSLRGALVIAVALLLQVVPAAVRAAAPPELAGVWQGKLAVDATNSLAVQFTFTKGSNGAYTAVLNSPDNPALKDTAVNGVTWDGTNLKLTVPSLSGSFAGALKSGKVDGKWTQPTGALPLVLSPYSKPVMSAAGAKSLVGSWSGKLVVSAGIEQNVVFEFKQAAGGAFEGTLNLPDNGLKLPMSSVVLENGELALKIPQGQVVLDYKGKLAGDQITGKMKVPNPALPPDGLPLNMKRGEYKVVTPALKLNAEAFAAVKGKWQGTLDVPSPAQAVAAGQPASVKVVVTVSFETNAKAKGEYIGYLSVTEPGKPPAGNSPGMVISEAQFADGKLALKAPAANIDYTGTVSGNTITGTWVQTALGRNIALTLTRQ